MTVDLVLLITVPPVQNVMMKNAPFVQTTLPLHYLDVLQQSVKIKNTKMAYSVNPV